MRFLLVALLASLCYAQTALSTLQQDEQLCIEFQIDSMACGLIFGVLQGQGFEAESCPPSFEECEQDTSELVANFQNVFSLCPSASLRIVCLEIIRTTDCCNEYHSSCLACRHGYDEDIYCSIYPSTPGCVMDTTYRPVEMTSYSPDDCCYEDHSSCLACQNGYSESWWCYLYPSTPGCVMHTTESPDDKITITNFFSITGDCGVQGDCVSSNNYPNAYGNMERCEVTMRRDAFIVSGHYFDIETCCDNLIIQGRDVEYSGNIPSFLSVGDSFSWSSDRSVTSGGWQLCFVEESVSTNEPGCCEEYTALCLACQYGLDVNTYCYYYGYVPGCYSVFTTAEPERTITNFFSTTGDCGVQGDCVSSNNYPNAYGNMERCEVTMLRDAFIMIGYYFDIETCCDNLIIQGRDVEYSGDIPSFLSAGESFSWSSDSSVTSGGWQLCFAEESSTNEPETQTTMEASVCTVYSSFDCEDDHEELEGIRCFFDYIYDVCKEVPSQCEDGDESSCFYIGGCYHHYGLGNCYNVPETCDEGDDYSCYAIGGYPSQCYYDSDVYKCKYLPETCEEGTRDSCNSIGGEEIKCFWDWTEEDCVDLPETCEEGTSDSCYQIEGCFYRYLEGICETAPGTCREADQDSCYSVIYESCYYDYEQYACVAYEYEIDTSSMDDSMGDDEWEDWTLTFSLCPAWGAWASDHCEDLSLCNPEIPEDEDLDAICDEFRNTECSSRREAQYHLTEVCSAEEGCGDDDWEIIWEYSYCSEGGNSVGSCGSGALTRTRVCDGSMDTIPCPDCEDEDENLCDDRISGEFYSFYDAALTDECNIDRGLDYRVLHLMCACLNSFESSQFSASEYDCFLHEEDRYTLSEYSSICSSDKTCDAEIVCSNCKCNKETKYNTGIRANSPAACMNEFAESSDRGFFSMRAVSCMYSDSCPEESRVQTDLEWILYEYSCTGGYQTKSMTSQDDFTCTQFVFPQDGSCDSMIHYFETSGYYSGGSCDQSRFEICSEWMVASPVSSIRDGDCTYSSTTYCLPSESCDNWCPGGEFSAEIIIEKQCTASKLELGLGEFDSCAMALPLIGSDEEQWEEWSDAECVISYLEMNEAECYASGGLVTSVTCADSVERFNAYLTYSEQDCDSDTAAETLQFVLNYGCCSTYEAPPLCDMDFLYARSEEESQCSAALVDDFEDSTLSCMCWEALGQDFREEYFNCRTDLYSVDTLIDIYNTQCNQRCAAWCMNKPEEWSVRCTWDGCADCDECQLEPPEDTMEPTEIDSTTEPQENLTTEPYIELLCASWCAKNGDWERICVWGSCGGCSECSEANIESTEESQETVEPTEIDTTKEPTEEPTRRCASWCMNKSDPWSVRCTWTGCMGCVECDSKETPTLTDFLTTEAYIETTTLKTDIPTTEAYFECQPVVCGCQPGYETLEMTDEYGCVTSCECVVGAECKSWCMSDPNDISRRCTWDSCAGCSQCEASQSTTVASGLTQEPATTVKPTEEATIIIDPSSECLPWCVNNRQEWETKCNWNACSGCTNCLHFSN